MTLLDYPRLTPGPADERNALRLAAQLTAHRSTAQINHALASLLLENMRLTAEANEHRAARGYTLLPVVDHERR